MLVFVSHPYHRGGVTSWIKEAVEACQRLAIPHKLVTVRPGKPFISGGFRPEMWTFVESGEHLISREVHWEFELGTMQYRALVIRDLIEEQIPPGAVLIPSDDEACWVACCMLSTTYRVVGVLHSDDGAYYRLADRYHTYLSGLVSVAERVRNNTPEYGLPHAVIPCGIDLRQFGDSSGKQERILWIGRLEEHQKRVTDIPLIAADLLKKRPEATIEIFGHGDKFDWLTETVRDRGLYNVSIRGWQSREIIAHALGESKILLQTSNFEGMSVAVMEALASGCAIVSTRVSGVEDLETDPESKNIVLLFETGNIEMAAQLIDYCLKTWDPSMQKDAANLARKHFSIEECLQAYLSFSKVIFAANLRLQIRSRLLTEFVSSVLSAARLTKFRISKMLSPN